MKNFANIFILACLFILPSVVQVEFSASKDVDSEISNAVQNHTESQLPQDGIYDPFLPLKGEASFSYSIKVPKPDETEKLQDQLSRESSNKTSYPDNTALFIASSSQIDVGLSIKKLIFPFHSFL